MDAVLHRSLPTAPWMATATRRMPGVQPLPMNDWLIRDEAFAGQMALRDDLIATRRDAVLAAPRETTPQADELLALILDHVDDGFRRAADRVIRPDNVVVDLSADTPLAIAGRLTQADLCLLSQPGPGAEPTLDAAILCFPASWTLSEKIGRPLLDIHAPVDTYTPDMARRVTRLFDALKPGRPLWRQNALLYADPTLFTPRSQVQPRTPPTAQTPCYLRSERQVLLRLPHTGAVVFAIHTYMVPFDALTGDQVAALSKHPIDYAGRNP